MTKRILIIGYGNPDREDDGVAWHVLMALAEQYGIPVPEDYLDGLFPENSSLDLLTALQLTPEMAETIAEYDAVCFVDAHTGAMPEDLNIVSLKPIFQNSPFTHHMTPDSVLSIVKELYSKQPVALLVSIRGYSFTFAHQLSSLTQKHAEEAVKQISHWIDDLQQN